jgi:hypothetical protein
MAMRGDEPMKIMRHAGHENMATTMGYVREAENLVTSVGDPFPALPEQVVSSGNFVSKPVRVGPTARNCMEKIGASPAGIGTLGHTPLPHDLEEMPQLAAAFAA